MNEGDEVAGTGFLIGDRVRHMSGGPVGVVIPALSGSRAPIAVRQWVSDEKGYQIRTFHAYELELVEDPE